MNDLYKRLATLQVADLMSSQVVEVSSHDAMETAADQLVKHEISGAPVVDEAGRCVGMLSAFDFVRRAGTTQDRPDEAHDWRRPDESGDRHLASIDVRVAHHMNSAVQAVAADAGALSAARMMCSEHIHRLVVLDDAGRPLGIVTALDLVAALVNSVDEQGQ